MVEHVCTQEARLKAQDDRIRDLEQDRAETKTYVKIIREDISDIKNDIKTISQAPRQEKPKNELLITLAFEALKVAASAIGAVVAVLAILKSTGKG